MGDIGQQLTPKRGVGRQTLRHAVENIRQLADLVIRLYRSCFPQLPLRDLLGDLPQLADWNGNAAGQGIAGGQTKRHYADSHPAQRGMHRFKKILLQRPHHQRHGRRTGRLPALRHFHMLHDQILLEQLDHLRIGQVNQQKNRDGDRQKHQAGDAVRNRVDSIHSLHRQTCSPPHRL